MKAKYTARAVRSGDWWAIDVPEIRGIHTQARRMDRIEYMARDAIALMLDVDPESFDVAVEVDLGTELDAMIRAATEARRQADAADREASDLVRRASSVLVASGLTVRDAGRLLGVSHQRIAQLAPQRAAAAGARQGAGTRAGLRMAASGKG